MGPAAQVFQLGLRAERTGPQDSLSPRAPGSRWASLLLPNSGPNHLITGAVPSPFSWTTQCLLGVSNPGIPSDGAAWMRSA